MWMLPVAALILLVPFFLVSWQTEALIIKRMTVTERHLVGSAVFRANLWSYALLAALIVGWTLMNHRILMERVE